jgi:predicted aldo/keto reductase-like oxidoreductase
MRMKRREFLAGSLAGVGGFLLGSGRVVASEQKPKFFDPYELVPLGKTNIKVSRVGLGTGMRGFLRQSNHTRMGHEKFNTLVRGCYERGVRLFDVADMYGTHPFLAEALKDMRREEYVITSKIWFRRGGLPEPERPNPDVLIERFLRELKTDYIDLILFHCVESANWPDELGEKMNILTQLRKKGIIRAHGLSCHSLPALERCVKESWVDSVHIRINPYAVKMDVRSVEEIPKVEAVARAIRSQGKAVIGMKIIGEGEFRNSDEMRNKSVKYALESNCVDAMVVGFEKIEEVDDFASRVRRVSRIRNSEPTFAYNFTQLAYY